MHAGFTHVAHRLQPSLGRLPRVLEGLWGLGGHRCLCWASVRGRGWGGESRGSDLGGGGRLVALGRISLSGWHQGESDNCSQIDKSFLQNGLAG